MSNCVKAPMSDMGLGWGRGVTVTFLGHLAGFSNHGVLAGYVLGSIQLGLVISATGTSHLTSAPLLTCKIETVPPYTRRPRMPSVLRGTVVSLCH